MIFKERFPLDVQGSDPECQREQKRRNLYDIIEMLEFSWLAAEKTEGVDIKS